MAFSSISEELGRIEGRLGDLWRRVMEDGRVQQAGRFEWVDSLLVRSLQQGHWLLIDNVNFCRYNLLPIFAAQCELFAQCL